MKIEFNLQPILENEMVKLRPLKEHDFEELYLAAKDPLIWAQHQNADRYKKQVFKTFFEDAIASKGALAVIDRSTQHIIGSSRFKVSERSDDAVEIGWSFLARKYWGGTYNKSFKLLMMHHAFGYFQYILYYINEKNIRSQRAVEKLGGKCINDKDHLKHLCHPDASALTYCILKSDFL